MEIDQTFSVKAFKSSTKVNLYDIFSNTWQHKLSSLSQLSQVIKKIELCLQEEIRKTSKNLLALSESNDFDELQKKQT